MNMRYCQMLLVKVEDASADDEILPVNHWDETQQLYFTFKRLQGSMVCSVAATKPHTTIMAFGKHYD